MTQQWLGPLAVTLFTWFMTRAELNKYRNKPAAIYRAVKRFFILRSAIISVLVWVAYFIFTYTRLG
jgi:hypothetical protein